MTPKELYEKAARATKQARALLDEWEGKSRPADIEQQIDALLAEGEEFKQKADDAVAAQGVESARRERLTALEKAANAPLIEARLPVAGGDARSGAAPAADPAPEAKAFNAVLRYGLAGARDIVPVTELKGLFAGDNTQGGYLVPPQTFVNQLIKFVDDEVFIRQFATIYPLTQAQSMGVPSLDTDLADAEWTSELGASTADTTLRVGKRELRPQFLVKEARCSKFLLEQSVYPAETLVLERVGVKIGYAQENGFLNGTGSNQPLGLFTPSSMGVSTNRDTTAASATALDGDDLINTKYALKSAYWMRPSTRWIIHRTVLGAIRKIKATTTGEYVWQQGLAAGQPDRLLDIPILPSEFAPSTIAASQYVALLGDLSKYIIADVRGVRIQVLVEKYADTNENAYIARMELDGMPAIEEAFRRLIMHS
jgi:HK97 family phage major capsid protein